jgi:hypothetical protein
MIRILSDLEYSKFAHNIAPNFRFVYNMMPNVISNLQFIHNINMPQLILIFCWLPIVPYMTLHISFQKWKIDNANANATDNELLHVQNIV